jgi:hypothetical protein
MASNILERIEPTLGKRFANKSLIWILGGDRSPAGFENIWRAMARGATREEALARLASQMPLAEKRKYADYVIDTSGTKEDTLLQTEEVYTSLRSLKL